MCIQRVLDSILRDLSLKVNQRTVVNLDVALSEDDIRRMRFQIDQLAKIRYESPALFDCSAKKVYKRSAY